MIFVLVDSNQMLNAAVLKLPALFDITDKTGFAKPLVASGLDFVL